MELNSIKSVFVYLRKSRDEDGIGASVLDNHKRQLMNICKNNKWDNVTIFEELGSGSSIDSRPVFQGMLDEISHGMADLVLVMDLDRISRGGGADWERVKKVFRENTTFLMTATGQLYDYNNIDNAFMSDLLSVFANFELQTIKKRYARGKKVSHSKGNYANGGNPAYGYIRNPKTKKLEIDKETVDVYNLIKDRSLKGFTDGQISKELKSMGLTTNRGAEWTPTAVYRILTNYVYLGWVILKKSTGSHKDGTYKPLPIHQWDIVKDAHPALITEDEFNRIKELLQARNITPVGARRGVYTLSGLIYCPYCNKVRSITKPQIRTTSPYIKPCRTKGCRNGGGILKPIEDVLNVKLKERLEEYKNGEPSGNVRVQEIRLKVKGAKTRIKKAEQGLDRLTDLYIDSLITKEKFQKKQNELKDELEKAKFDLSEGVEALKNVNDIENVQEYQKRLELFYNAWNDNKISSMEKNRLAKLFIDKIYMTKSQKKMTLDIHFQ